MAEYREVKRKARKGELIKVIDTSDDGYDYDGVCVGDILTVNSADRRDGHVWFDGTTICLLPTEYVVLEPVTDSPTLSDSERIEALEQRVMELETQLYADINQPSGLRKVTNYIEENKHEHFATVRQHTREQVVKMAKADVEGMQGEWFDMRFVENRAKRIVVALLSNQDGKVTRRGKSRACDGDVFNIHIGRALSLRRALGKPVPDYYTNAPQPTEAQVGDVVRTHASGSILTLKYRRPDRDYANYRAFEYVEGGWDIERSFTLVDDSHDYGGKEV